ncbi:MAG: ATP-dependent DNA helicase Rep [Gammaproteobacteria bacterium]|nr:MAG: ATP-dependent DNA helicase Rep [Gammaproteobacteria bacterium]PIE36622.1 MAG: ATP-dependent DNA helicase Rep [Gammaproteobacteria bacterium]
MGLNPQQQSAVTSFDTPLLVLAGAGSGKTGVITEKIAWLIEHQSYTPESIVAVTFTNKAANEMRERLAKKIPKAVVRRLTIATFHRLGINILNKDGAAVGVRPGFTILDQSDSVQVIRELIREGQLAVDERDTQHTISRWKNDFLSPQRALGEATTDREQAEAIVYQRYDEWLRACNSTDFDDLISLPVRLFDTDHAVRDRWRGRIRHLLVDEYQDTNAAQYALVKQLVDRFGAFTAVGDDDQSIYSWRGARPENLAALRDDYPNLRVVKLEQNYRSSQRILRSANAVIANNPHVFEKRLWSELGLGDELRLSVCRHSADEADWVVAEILSRHYRQGLKFGDFAVLYRSNFQARAFEKALREKKIPYRISGGSSFFDKAEIKDMLAYLRLLVNPDDDTAFLRCINTPRREIGASTLAKLGEQARGRGVSLFAACHDIGLETKLSGKALDRVRRFVNWLVLTADNAERGNTLAVINGLFDDIGYRDWLEQQADTPAQAERAIGNTDELLDWIRRLADDPDHEERSLAAIVQQLSLHDMLSRQDDDNDHSEVQLMTLHAAKGLEFPHVYMVGLEEELLPHRNSADEHAIEEERRLMYVGMTRARRSLTFTRCRTRQAFGETGSVEPSRFLDEIPAEDLVVIGEDGSRSEEEERAIGSEALSDMLSMLSAP